MIFYNNDSKKKEKNSYTTSDPNDPRLKAYSDSLRLYNHYIMMQKELDRLQYKENLLSGGYNLYDKAANIVESKLRGEDMDDLYLEKGLDLKKEGEGLYSVMDLYPSAVNKNFKVRNLFSTKIDPAGRNYYLDESGVIPGILRGIIPTGPNEDYDYQFNEDPRNPASFLYDNIYTGLGAVLGAADMRVVFDYSNVNPKQKVVYIPKKEPKPAAVPDRPDHNIRKLESRSIGNLVNLDSEITMKQRPQWTAWNRTESIPINPKAGLHWREYPKKTYYGAIQK